MFDSDPICWSLCTGKKQRNSNRRKNLNHNIYMRRPYTGTLWTLQKLKANFLGNCPVIVMYRVTTTRSDVICRFDCTWLTEHLTCFTTWLLSPWVSVVKNSIRSLLHSVLPAPLSPLMTIACFCSVRNMAWYAAFPRA